MGKSKKRIFNKLTENTGTVLKRTDVLSSIASDIKNNNISSETKKNICLFGISAEELLEFGVSLEDLSVIRKFLI